MRHLNPARESGLTLIELMVGLSIAALLAMSAAPYFVDYIANSRLREAGNLVYSEALAAQSEAVKRNSTVRLVTSGINVLVVDMTNTAQPTTLRMRRLNPGLSASNTVIDFGAEGRPVPFGTAGAVDISMTGITCSGDYRCPGLRVDAGGAVRLCGDRTSGSC